MKQGNNKNCSAKNGSSNNAKNSANNAKNAQNEKNCGGRCKKNNQEND